MENTVEIYQEEKELRGKRLAVYAETIQNSSSSAQSQEKSLNERHHPQKLKMLFL